MSADKIHKIFNERADKVDGHDPWRYGDEISHKTDMVEFGWLDSTIGLDEPKTLIDVGCGTGRHVHLMAEKMNSGMVIGCDFVKKNIEYLRSEAERLGLDNVRGVVCGGVDFAEHVDIDHCDVIIAIGLVQYLTSEEELKAFSDCCNSLLSSGGSLILKHPLATVPSYLKDYIREEMDTRYIARYHDLNDLMAPLNDSFEIHSIERTFTLENSGENLSIIETDERARQMWIHLKKR